MTLPNIEQGGLEGGVILRIIFGIVFHSEYFNKGVWARNQKFLELSFMPKTFGVNM